MARTPVTSGSRDVLALERTGRRRVQIVERLGLDRRAAVHRLAEAVEHAAQQAAARLRRAPLRGAPPRGRPAAGRRSLRAASSSTRPSRKPITCARTVRPPAASNLAEIADRRRRTVRFDQQPDQSRVTCPAQLQRLACAEARRCSRREIIAPSSSPHQTSAKPRSISSSCVSTEASSSPRDGFENHAAPRRATASAAISSARRQVQPCAMLPDQRRRRRVTRAAGASRAHSILSKRRLHQAQHRLRIDGEFAMQNAARDRERQLHHVLLGFARAGACAVPASSSIERAERCEHRRRSSAALLAASPAASPSAKPC